MKSSKGKKLDRLKGRNSSGKFELRFYSGHKGYETPRSVVIGNREFKIEKVIWRKRILDKKSGKRIEVYKCKMDGKTVEITQHESGRWTLSFPEKA